MSISGSREPGIARVNQPRAVGRAAFFERRSEYKESRGRFSNVKKPLVFTAFSPRPSIRRARGPSGAFPGAPGVLPECDPIPTLLRPQTQLVAQTSLGAIFHLSGVICPPWRGIFHPWRATFHPWMPFFIPQGSHAHRVGPAVCAERSNNSFIFSVENCTSAPRNSRVPQKKTNFVDMFGTWFREYLSSRCVSRSFKDARNVAECPQHGVSN